MSQFSHFDEQGRTRMVNVGEKPVTDRFARASGVIQMKRETLDLVRTNGFEKGNVLEVARLAGIMSTKRTADLIPLCHPLPIAGVEVEFSFRSETEIQISASVSVSARTGAEMEALTAVSTAALTVYDMCKSVDKTMVINAIQLDEKRGGKSGHFVRKNDSTNESI